MDFDKFFFDCFLIYDKIRQKRISMEQPLNQYSNLLNQLHQIARKSDCYLIARIQEKKIKSVDVLNNKLESAQKSNIKGIGMRIFTKTGHNAFGSTDDLQDEKQVIQLLEKIIFSAKKSQKLKFSANKEIFKLKPVKDIVIPKTEYIFDDIALKQIEKDLIDINKQAKKMNFTVAESFFNIEEECWKITRTDGTDIVFKIPRSILYCILIYKKQGQTIQRSVRASGKSYEILFSKRVKEKFIKQMRNLSKEMPEVIKAPVYKSGNYDLLLDAELAGVLIHEAFGHAAESDDIFAGSILSKNKKILKNKKVANSVVSIYDFANENERGFYPYDSQGKKREKITIVDKGVLKQAISDIYTAKKINAPLTGGAKAEFYSSIPVPRMSNTILEIQKVINDKLLSKSVIDISVKDIQNTLIKNGIFRNREKIVYLKGSRGGQVDTTKGTFMLGTDALYEITKNSIKLFKPASFSGTTLGALKAINFAMGKKSDLLTPGTCGKAGQWAPVSDIANKFIFISADKDVKIGGN
jgi:TldD protein